MNGRETDVTAGGVSYQPSDALDCGGMVDYIGIEADHTDAAT
jgi:hypothetical protein